MLEHYFCSRSVLDRLRCNPIYSHIERLADYFYGRGYAVLTVQSYLQAAEHFGNWLGSLPSHSIVIDEETVRAFVTIHLSDCNCIFVRLLRNNMMVAQVPIQHLQII